MHLVRAICVTTITETGRVPITKSSVKSVPLVLNNAGSAFPMCLFGPSAAACLLKSASMVPTGCRINSMTVSNLGEQSEP